MTDSPTPLAPIPLAPIPLAQDLRAALAAGDVHAVYQQVFDSHSLEVVGCETLARWTHPTLGEVPLDVLVAAAADFGALLDLTMVEHAATQLTAWGEVGPERISLNVTPESLRTPGFAKLVDDAVRAHGHTLERFSFGISECDRLDDDAIATATMLRKLGAHLSLDDLGTGFSVVLFVNELEVDELRIDASFVSGITTSRRSRVVVQALAGIADELNCQLVAKGVASDEVADVLAGLGVGRLQGFHLGRPVAGADLVFPARVTMPGSFQPAGIVPHELERQAALDAYRIMDTAPEATFDRLVQIAAEVCGADKAMVNFAAGNRLWFKSTLGFEGTESSRQTSFCDHVIYDHETGRSDPATQGVLVVEDASHHPRFADNPNANVPGGVRMYAGAPLVSGDGHAIGTLCVFDSDPKRLTDSQIGILSALAGQVMAHLELRVVTADLAAVVESRALAEAALLHEATHDHLTGLANRRLFFSTLEILSDAGIAFGVVFADLDGFKQVNDRLGHVAGDEHLQWCAEALTRAVRAEDIVARVGGDEFAVIVPGVSADLDTIAERVRTALGRTLVADGGDIIVAGSVGVSSFVAGNDLEALLHEADCQMYDEKTRHKTAAAQG